MMKIEPMTAAEYRRDSRNAITMFPDGYTARVLAALEEREEMMEARAEFYADAALGALVRRIGEHPMADDLAFRVSAKPDPIHFYYKWQESALVEALDRLDSLLPKEPEVAPSGRTYKFEDGWLKAHVRGNAAVQVIQIQAEDREFVAKLLGGSNAK